MRVILCPEFSGPKQLVVAEYPEPEPGPGQVLVQHEAWGVNHVDALMVEGLYQHRPPLPFVPGLEAAGRILAITPGFVSEFALAVGDAVITTHRPGAFAERAAVPATRVWPVPPSLSFREAAVFRSAYHTALHALSQRGSLVAGETVLVHGAGGGIGLAAVHCACRLGSRVIATAGTDEKCALLRRHGAEIALNVNNGFRDAVLDATDGCGADVIFDPVGGDVFDESMRCIAWGGRLLVLGFTSGRRAQARTNHILIKGVSVIGVRAGEAGRRDPRLPQATWTQLVAWVRDGLRPHISHVYPFARAGEAIQAVRDRKITGKAVLVADD